MPMPRPPVRAVVTAALAALLVVGAASAQGFDDPDYARLFSDALHDLPMPEPGRFRVEFEGEVHEGDLSECGVILDPANGDDWHRFDATGSWLNQAGQARAFEVIRFVSDVEPSWRFTGHETDRVSVTTRHDGDLALVSSGAIDAEMPRARAEALRREPQGDLRKHGAGDAPLIRVLADGVHATVVAVLDVHPAPPNHDYYDDDTVHVIGPVAIAMRCAP
jgi:hypothetical protein